MKPVNILVIRSAARVFSPTLTALKREFPVSRITVLAPEPLGDALSRDPEVDEVLPLKAGRRMSVFSYGLDNLRQLRRRKFDLAVALYNIERGLGYSNIDLLAWASDAGQLRGYNCKGGFVSLSGSGIAGKYLREKISILWMAANVLATAVLFLMITLGLAGEWCFRKLFRRGTPRPPAD
ncbi:MAG: glycosyltransferase family 9 protein [Nitrospinales bacterium]